jgi:hypothetical protein
LKADPRFLKQSREFWANVRIISQEVGYTVRGKGTIVVPTPTQIREAFNKLSLSTDHIADEHDNLTSFGATLIAYFTYRAELLYHVVQHYLMTKEQARTLFMEVHGRVQPRRPIPMNKQKGDKQDQAYLTGLVNMLIEEHIGNAPCNYNPQSLTTMTHNGRPLRTLSRRVDGAFPTVVNPIAIWEIKEHYNTKTFGSRVADGVYETLLDGFELEELELAAGRKVHHMLVVDDHFTWWIKGRSYLCRIIDMLHMGYIDEVLFGKEVVDRLPLLVGEWLQEYDRRA